VLGYLCLLVRPAVGLLTAEEDDESRGLFVMPLIIGAMLLMSLTESMLFVHNCMANGVFFLACGHTLRGWKNRKKDAK
jgi:cytochrome b561